MLAPSLDLLQRRFVSDVRALGAIALGIAAGVGNHALGADFAASVDAIFQHFLLTLR